MPSLVPKPYVNQFFNIKPNNAGKDMRLLTQTENQKFKQKAQTQDADGTQALLVLYLAQL